AITIFVLAGKEERMKQGGYLSYGKALKTTFLAGFTGMVISGLFTLILINLIDPGLADVLKEQILESTRSMMESFGAPEDTISEAMEKTEEGMEDQFTPLSQLLNILKGGIFVLVIAAIVSIFIKKEEKIV
ncbi:MAG: DUF4199 domain-containing protein, partial [Saprospiraceae bacterium]|nr:DUF4199 domain-containing protein [Saprospiraceae bacterium]